ncbi:MAG TPA: hypothetical protein VFP10_04340, partial [Candidatus Eisenbacteria bacterium]|nr:hypothetical protein [Candidatus Eisenbacteria bacterium]
MPLLIARARQPFRVARPAAQRKSRLSKENKRFGNFLASVAVLVLSQRVLRMLPSALVLFLDRLLQVLR